MCTEQNYVGKGDYANDFEQSADTAPSNSSSADNQPSSHKTVEVNRQIYEAQTKLLALVEDFINCHGAANPIEVINDLLFRWLALPTTDLKLDANRNQLFSTQKLIDFLAKLSESATKLEQIRSNS